MILASALTPSVLGRVYPSKADVGFYVGAVVFGLIFGFLAFRYQRHMVIFATAYGGAFAFFFGIGYFVGSFPDKQRSQQCREGPFRKMVRQVLRHDSPVGQHWRVRAVSSV